MLDNLKNNMYEDDLNKYGAVDVLDRNKDIKPKLWNKQNLEKKKDTAQILMGVFEINDVAQ